MHTVLLTQGHPKIHWFRRWFRRSYILAFMNENKLIYASYDFIIAVLSLYSFVEAR